MVELRSSIEVEYPETDGLEMGETQLHRLWMEYLVALFDHRYRDQNVFVGGNLMVYFVEGQPHRHVCPDVFVTRDCPPTPLRDVFKTWEEGRVPEVVFELSSSSTKRWDQVRKPRTYAEIGTSEHFLFDPTGGRFVSPVLQGHRLEGDRMVAMEPDEQGRLTSEVLDLVLRVNEREELELLDRSTGLLLETEEEELQRLADELARRNEQLETRYELLETKNEQLETTNEQLETTNEQLEAELRRLRERLGEE